MHCNGLQWRGNTFDAKGVNVVIQLYCKFVMSSEAKFGTIWKILLHGQYPQRPQQIWCMQCILCTLHRRQCLRLDLFSTQYNGGDCEDSLHRKRFKLWTLPGSHQIPSVYSTTVSHPSIHNHWQYPIPRHVNSFPLATGFLLTQMMLERKIFISLLSSWSYLIFVKDAKDGVRVKKFARCKLALYVIPHSECNATHQCIIFYTVCNLHNMCDYWLYTPWCCTEVCGLHNVCNTYLQNMSFLHKSIVTQLLHSVCSFMHFV